MALEHAILVSLSERASSGYDLARRFDKSIGYFWTATHQQVYKVLARMEGSELGAAHRRRRRTADRTKSCMTSPRLGRDRTGALDRRSPPNPRRRVPNSRSRFAGRPTVIPARSRPRSRGTAICTANGSMSTSATRSASFPTRRG